MRRGIFRVPPRVAAELEPFAERYGPTAARVVLALTFVSAIVVLVGVRARAAVRRRWRLVVAWWRRA